MDIEKLIEQLRTESLYADKASLEIMDLCMDAATVLSTLQAENAQLRGELEYEQQHANAYHEECGQWEVENEKLRAELEQVKRERNTAVKQLHGICSVCKNYSHYHNRGKCRFCMYEPARDKDAEVNDNNDNWEWRGTQKEN